MSAARRVRGNLLTAHKAAGTYTPVRLVGYEVSKVICQAARIPRDRKSVYFESSASNESRTATRKPSAVSRQFAPPDLQTVSAYVSAVAKKY